MCPRPEPGAGAGLPLGVGVGEDRVQDSEGVGFPGEVFGGPGDGESGSPVVGEAVELLGGELAEGVGGQLHGVLLEWDDLANPQVSCRVGTSCTDHRGW